MHAWLRYGVDFGVHTTQTLHIKRDTQVFPAWLLDIVPQRVSHIHPVISILKIIYQLSFIHTLQPEISPHFIKGLLDILYHRDFVSDILIIFIAFNGIVNVSAYDNVVDVHLFQVLKNHVVVLKPTVFSHKDNHVEIA